MYCRNCGKEIDDNAVVCVHCGTTTKNYVPEKETINQPKESNTIAIVGLVFAFLSPLVGLICSIIGYRKAKQQGLEYGGLALAGIIISAVEMVVTIICSIVLYPMLVAIIEELMYI